MTFVLPSKSQVGYLDPEIAGEGQKVILSDGEQVSWSPPPARPVMPDWSQIKSIQRYFGRTGHQVYPAWLYHSKEEPRLVKNAEEAATLGICYRDATQEERGRYGLNAVWDWADDSQWRPKPHDAIKFDASKPGPGKTVIHSQPNPAIAQHALLQELIPAVAAAVAQSLKATGPSAPAHIDSKDWDDFLQFKAWQKSSQAVELVSAASAVPEMTFDAPEESALDDAENLAPINALSGEDEKALWIAEGERKGVKIDKRWSLERLKAEIQKAA